MGTGDILVLVICLLLIAVIFMGAVEMTVPIFKKIEVNSIGETYMALIDMNNGLTVLQRAELETKLNDAGLENITITYPLQGSTRFGDKLELIIETTYGFRMFGDLSSTVETLNINFTDDITNRRIEN